MELLSEVLWKACSWVLLGFLVERLIFLLVCLSDDYNDNNSVSGLIKEKGIIKQSLIVDDHEFDEQENGVFSKKKRVEFQEVDFGGELNSTKNDEVVFGNEFFQDLIKGFNEYNEGIEGNYRVMNIEGEEFGEEFVGKNEEKGENFVGFEDKFGGKLDSGKKIVDDHVKDEILRVNDGECHGIDVNLGRGKIGDDGRKGENLSNGDGRGEISGRELTFSKDEGVLSDDEEWEGIERSELEKRFAEAMNVVEKEGKLVKRGDDVNLQLYGLQKVAMEGPCYEAQPMALKLNARAKWNAWQRLGNMTREDAMEQYINLMSDTTLKGMDDGHSSVADKSSSSETAVDSYPGAN